MKTRSHSNVNYTLVSKSTINNDIYEDPNNFSSAWDHPNSTERVNWRLAIEYEIKKIIEKNVFELVDREKIPFNQKPILTKWVFKRKNDFRYRERLVAFGFQQKPGIYFFDSHSPVLHDICTRLLMIIGMKEDVKIVLVDVTKAFLESNLKEDIFIEIPKGYIQVLKAENIEDKVIKLNKAVYGLKQASRCFFEHITSYFKSNLQYTSCPSDPCLLKSSKEGSVNTLCGIYVDDILLCGQEKSVENDISELKSKFDITVNNEFQDYVGCDIIKEKSQF